ncbi:hypothetical protein HCH_02838 [Hahella chejuensis KCTC 2396]|uniref:Uncharacterized protein n=1 Tax=Hahella chejuensis (strain KCTC 2396) TaxID=349521 RepID=Q2SIA8_HAHCH|nr:hypothetical protein HCH_02838 [Hahella chejuensis KCTC 2396]
MNHSQAERISSVHNKGINLTPCGEDCPGIKFNRYERIYLEQATDEDLAT